MRSRQRVFLRRSAHGRVRAAVGRAARRAARVRHLLLQLGQNARLRRVRDAKVLARYVK